MEKTSRKSNNQFCIEISSAQMAPLRVMQYPGRFAVVSLRDSKQKKAPIDQVKLFCRDILVRHFDDIKRPWEGFVAPSEEDVRVILDWSKGKGDILVHCVAGVSRSSAIAYLIACSRMSPQKAIKVLNPKLHWPNPLIVKIGANVLDNLEVYNVIEQWKSKFEDLEDMNDE